MSDPKVIGRRLGISLIETSTAIKRLIEFGYLEVSTKGVLTRTTLPFMIQMKSAGPAIREYHLSRLKAAEAELGNTNENRVNGRYFQTLFIPSSRKAVAGASRMIAQFQEKLLNYLINEKEKTENNELFQFSLQLFSVEKKENYE
jgi:hypothetical protein